MEISEGLLNAINQLKDGVIDFLNQIRKMFMQLKDLIDQFNYLRFLDNISDEVLSMCMRLFKTHDEEVEFFKRIFYSSIDDVRDNKIIKNFVTYLILKYNSIAYEDLEFVVVKTFKDYAEEKINNIDYCVI